MNIRYFKKPLPNFADEAVWNDLERQCYDGTIDYEDFPADEYKYFDKLRIVYLRYKFDNMPKAEAAESKRLLLKEYKLSKDKAAQSFKVCRKYQNNIKKFELLKTAINKAGSAQDKLTPALEIIGMITDDDIFMRINLEE